MAILTKNHTITDFTTIIVMFVIDVV